MTSKGRRSLKNKKFETKKGITFRTGHRYTLQDRSQYRGAAGSLVEDTRYPSSSSSTLILRSFSNASTRPLLFSMINLKRFFSVFTVFGLCGIARGRGIIELPRVLTSSSLVFDGEPSLIPDVVCLKPLSLFSPGIIFFLRIYYTSSFLSFFFSFFIFIISFFFLFSILYFLLFYLYLSSLYRFTLLYIYYLFRFIFSNYIFSKYLFRIPLLILFLLYRVHGINRWVKSESSERCEIKRLNREDRRTTRRDVLCVLADPTSTHTMRKASLLRVSTLLHPPRDSFIVLHRAPSASARMRRSKDFQNVPLAFQHPIPVARRNLSRCVYSLSRHD